MGHFDHDHQHPHTHEHTHDGVAHTHEHTHEGDHVHAHAPAGEQTVAVLKYMLDHNIHHASELNDIAQSLTGEAKHQLLHAVEAFDQANGYLSAALEELKK